MAAVTIEDCLKIIPNRFELALIASCRTEQLMNGAPVLYAAKKTEKNTVIALREIAAGLLDINKIREEIKEKLRNPSLFKAQGLTSDKIIKDDDVESIPDSDLDEINDESSGDDIESEEEEDDDDFGAGLNTEDIEDDDIEEHDAEK
jgi:DNA-directed RNA polymerase subunit omega